jgi:HEAT repeat protein
MRGQYNILGKRQLQTVRFTILGLFCASTLPFCVNSSAIAQTPIATTICTTAEINKYIKKLEISEPNAFDALVACELKAVPPLVKALENNDEKIRILIISALGAIGEQAKPAEPRLSKLLSEETRKSVRVATVYALAEIGKDGVPSVVSALQDSDWYIRYTAADALGEMGANAKEAIPALNAALKDKDWYVSSTVTRAIEKISNSVNITGTGVSDQSRVPRPPVSTGDDYRGTNTGVGVTIKIGSYSVERVTSNHFQKPPVMCRIALIRAVFRWKCPSIRWQDAYTKK